ncbi:MAG: hypothetical protein K2X43_01260 [Hyphomonadaceae bacterium]|nr:hypothetical protein [Hyphomonadaceae bacterium]
MANNTLTADVIASASLAILENELGILKTMHRAYEDEFTEKVNGYNIGDTLSIRRPADFTVRSGAAASNQDVIEGKVQIVLDQMKGIDFSFTSTELTLKIEDLSERVLKPAMSSLINDVARDVFSEMYKSSYEVVNCATTGATTAPDNTKRIDSFAKFTCAPERLDLCAVPTSDRAAGLHTADNWGMIGAQTGLFNGGLVNSAYTDGNLGRVGGMDTYASQVMPTHTVGPLGGAPLINGASQNVTYDSVKNTWSQSLITDGWTAAAASRWLRGDTFTIANVFKVNPKTKVSTGVLQTFVVLADVSSDGLGNLTASISPPIIIAGPHQTVNAAPADNAAITTTIGGAANAQHRQNLAYHRTSMALAFAPLVLPQGAVNPTRKTYKNMSVRLIPYYTGSTDVSAWRLDILYGRKAIDPRKISRFTSG